MTGRPLLHVARLLERIDLHLRSPNRLHWQPLLRRRTMADSCLYHQGQKLALSVQQQREITPGADIVRAAENKPE